MRVEKACHKTGWRATYMHLKEVLVRTGQRVARGEAIGLVGTTGRSTGPHLHYQIDSPAGRPGGAVDPQPAMCGP